MWNLSCFLAPLPRQSLASSCPGARRVQDLRQSAAGPPSQGSGQMLGFGTWMEMLALYRADTTGDHTLK